ncbi:MAG: UDP-glucose/GDP-mannose dehydrogenase family protein [Rickettsiales bacterium]|jgi:UDPglucose 6-dehydrogenase|nr:UDP-glucose/GDP-mannose dehydrogenase family protein [Rickettsiales bacterium]
MKIAIIGTGYVGLPAGAVFADLGHSVACIDKNAQKIADLNAGKTVLFEEGLDELIARNVGKNLKFTTDISAASDAEFIILAVGTPEDKKTGQADLQYIYAAAREVAPHLANGAVVATKSTVPVGTGDEIERIMRTANPDGDFDVISMPEFLREGFAVYDVLNPDRVVAGGNSARAFDAVRELYSVFKTPVTFLFTDRRSSELIKYASNAFLAVKIHYINQIANLCEAADANVDDVARGMGLDSRIGPKFLNAGPGYGGSCFPKDTAALEYTARQYDLNLSLVDTAIRGNRERQANMAKRIIRTAAVAGIENPVVAAWGLAFKNGTDDVRESPAIRIIRELVANGARVVAYDPKAMETAREILGDSISYAPDAISAANGADVLAVLTEWPEFSDVPLDALKMRNKIIVDLRNKINPTHANELGFEYHRIGKK